VYIMMPVRPICDTSVRTSASSCHVDRNMRSKPTSQCVPSSELAKCHSLYRLPPLWPSGQSSWLNNLRTRVRFPVLPDFIRSSGSRTGSTEPREDN
jgi:hypothetical protein